MNHERLAELESKIRHEIALEHGRAITPMIVDDLISRLPLHGRVASTVYGIVIDALSDDEIPSLTKELVASHEFANLSIEAANNNARLARENDIRQTIPPSKLMHMARNGTLDAFVAERVRSEMQEDHLRAGTVI